MLGSSRLFIIGVASAISACSADAQSQQPSLAEISTFTTKFCAEYFNGKTEEKHHLNFEAEAKLNSFFKRVVGAGANVDTEVLSSSTIGLIDEMLVKDRASIRDCKLAVLDRIMNWNDHGSEKSLPNTKYNTTINHPEGTFFHGDTKIENAIFGGNGSLPFGDETIGSAGTYALNSLYNECQRPSPEGRSAWYGVNPRYHHDFVKLMEKEVPPDDHKFLLDILYRISDQPVGSVETFDAQIYMSEASSNSLRGSIDSHKMSLNQMKNMNLPRASDAWTMTEKQLENLQSRLLQAEDSLKKLKDERLRLIETTKEIETLKPRACQIVVTAYEKLETAK